MCDDADIGCSDGFHAGSYDYAKGYSHNGGHLMRVEIDPSDVVSVPKDCDCQKLRTAKYTVVALHETIEEPLDEGIYGEWDDDIEDDIDEGGAEYGAGWDAGYDQAKRENGNNPQNN